MRELRSILDYLADCTALELRHLLAPAGSYVGRMSKWTGRYARADKPGRSDEVGFLAGRLWLLERATGNAELGERARWLVGTIAGLMDEAPTLIDASWEIYFGLALGAEITGSRDWAEKALAAARHQDRNGWSDRAGAFVFEIGDERLIPFEASANMTLTGWASGAAPELLTRYKAHLDRLLELGFVRADGSSYHIAQLDADHRLQLLTTYQGYAAESTWARGQAWGMMGFLAAYEATGEQRYRDVVLRMSEWWLRRTAKDPVPFYDFDDPGGDTLPRDSCAAAIVANVLLRLHRLEGDSRYLAAADATITELASNYLGRGGCLLHGSGGTFHPFMFGVARTRRPPTSSGKLGFARRFPQEEILHYGDYFFVEALYRRMFDDWSIFELPSRLLRRS